MLTEQIVMRLAALAQMSGQNIAPFLLDFTARKLEDLGPGVLPALEKMMETSRRFPLVAEVKAAMGLADQTPEDEGRAVAARIWQGIAKFGDMKSERRQPELREFLGPAAWAVVEAQGGWSNVVSGSSYDAEIALKAQWRDLAISFAKRKNAPGATALPQGGQNPILSLVSGMTNIVDVGRKR